MKYLRQFGIILAVTLSLIHIYTIIHESGKVEKGNINFFYILLNLYEYDNNIRNFFILIK